MRFPVWYVPRLGEGILPVLGYSYCRHLVVAGTTPETVWDKPPLIISFVDNLVPQQVEMAVERVLGLSSPGGPPLVFHVHLGGATAAGPAVLFPSNDIHLPPGPPRDLFRWSSVLPDYMIAFLRNFGLPVGMGARGMIYNASVADLIRMLSLVKAYAAESPLSLRERGRGVRVVCSERRMPCDPRGKAEGRDHDLRFDTRLFTLAKDPEQPGAYQDACCVDTEHHIAAIADGVSSALFSGPWAAILAEAVVADSPNPCDPEEFAAWLQRQRERWAASIDTSSLAWFQKAKLPHGGLFHVALCPRLRGRRRPGRGLRRLPPGGLRPGRQLPLPGPRRRTGAVLSRWRLPRSSRPIRSCWAASIWPRPPAGIRNSRRDVLSWRRVDPLHRCRGRMGRARATNSGEPPAWSDFWQMSEDDWRSGVVWLRQERQMRIDDATMLMLRVVDDRVETHAGDGHRTNRHGRSGNESRTSPRPWHGSSRPRKT